jgi:hypothetical protein
VAKGLSDVPSNRSVMQDNPADEAPMDALAIQVAGAMARQYASDSRSFLNHLARVLVSALGQDSVEVKRSGLLGGDSRPVRRIAVEFTEEAGARASRYVIEATNPRGTLAPTRVQIVRNITLKTEPLTVEKWIEEVGAAIAAEAEQHRASRDALNALL